MGLLLLVVDGGGALCDVGVGWRISPHFIIVIAVARSNTGLPIWGATLAGGLLMQTNAGIIDRLDVVGNAERVPASTGRGV